MACVAKDGKGWRVVFVAPDGKRKTVRLGRVDKKTAESIRYHVEALLAARITGCPVQQATAVWVAGTGRSLRNRLVRAGLLEQAQEITLGEYLADYVARRKDVKPSTLMHWKLAQESLLTYFQADRPLASITTGDALAFAQWLRTPEARRTNRIATLSPNTICKRIQCAKQFFQDAVDRELLVRNPFAKLRGGVRSNRTRDYFIAPEMAYRVLEACPDAEWRAMFALARWGAVRVPSELLALTWADVNWEHNRLRVPSPKTARHGGHDCRIIPLFPELRRALEELWDVTPPGTTYIVTRYRLSNVNLRTQLQRIIQRAGLQPWPKLWQNLRATRATELAGQHRPHVAAAWCGHTVQIADRHYWQVTEADFERAIQGGTNSGAPVAQKAAQQAAATAGKIEK